MWLHLSVSLQALPHEPVVGLLEGGIQHMLYPTFFQGGGGATPNLQDPGSTPLLSMQHYGNFQNRQATGLVIMPVNSPSGSTLQWGMGLSLLRLTPPVNDILGFSLTDMFLCSSQLT